MTVYIENAKGSTKKLLKHNKQVWQGYKMQVNIQKSVAFQYASNEQVEFEIKIIIAYILVSPKSNYSGINLTKYAEDLYEEKHKTMMKEIKEELFYSCIRRQ